MSTPTVPVYSKGPPVAEGHQPWTAAAFLSEAAILVWFPLMFAFGYLLTDLFGVDPSQGQMIADQGVAGRAVSLGFAVLVGLPGWIGAAFGLRARRLGAGPAAVVAIVLGLVLALALLVWCIVSPL